MEFDSQSLVSTGRGGRVFERPGSDIRKTGYLKKLKTMKKKFFVLRSTSSSGPARLEYVDSEKKFKTGAPPKRSIQLHTCFNINRKMDNRNCKHGIALYTSEDCFVVLAESEDDQEAWFSIMLEYQNEYLPDGDMHKEHYEHVWQVNLQPKGLGKAQKGSYRLCLNSTTVCMVRTNSSKSQFTIQLVTIRQVAFSDCTFRIEVGKYAPTGEGEFWFSVEDPSTAKDMHGTLLHYMNNVKEPGLKKEHQFRTRSESHSSMSPNRHRPTKVEQRPQSFYTPPTSWHSTDATSPIGNPPYLSQFGSFEQGPGPHRPRSDTGDSRVSHASSQFEDSSHEIIATYEGDGVDERAIKDDKQHISIVPIDMSPPPSPSGLDEEINDYMGMEPINLSSGSTPTAPPSSSSIYLPMNMSVSSSHIHSQDLSPSVSDVGYIPLGPSALSHSPPSVIPIHSHGYGEGHHSSHSAHPTYPPPLPTVREGGSNEGYLPMDISSSPSSSSIPRPEPAKCMLSDDNSGLPPRTYSLGSKPVCKKYSGYMDMAPRKGAVGNDMSRAISAPHIIHKGRRDRDREQHVTESPTPSPLSMSVKSDDSDSFMEYMPMRPRTSSDSFNYRPRTSSFGKLQSTCRPRSSSHGQGTRPFTKANKLIVEQARISHDPLQRMSRESSIHGSFDSLRVSNESLRRMSQDSRYSPLVNEHDEFRGSPPLIGKNVKNDSYVNMDVSSGTRKSSPHRIRTDSSGSGRRSDKTTSSERSLHSQDNSTYTEMAPVNARVSESEGYMNMTFNNNNRQSAVVPGLSTSFQSSRLADSAYMSMEAVGDAKGRRSDSFRSVSVENVDSYVTYDPAPVGSNKPRTGSLGSKDKKLTQTLKKSSSSSPASHQHQPSVSASTRKGGSSDSLKKTSRQSSMEKYGSLGKDFRKKSGSTGSRPMSAKSGDMLMSSSMIPLRNQSFRGGKDEPADEYIEFSPTAVLGENDSMGIRGSSGSFSSQGRVGVYQGTMSARLSHPNTYPHPSSQQNDDSTFTILSPQVPQPSHHFSSATDDSSYMPFAPAPQSLSRSPHRMHDNFFSSRPNFLNAPSTQTPAKQISAKEMPDYVGFDPDPSHHPPVVPNLSIQPMSAVSYIVGETNSGSNSKLKNLKAQHSSLDSSKQAKRLDQRTGSTSPSLTMSTSLTFDPPIHSTDLINPHHPQPSSSFVSLSSPFCQLPKPEPVPSPMKGTGSMSKDAVSSSKRSDDNSEYISCSPATPVTGTSTKGQLIPTPSLISEHSKQSSSKGLDLDVKNDKEKNSSCPIVQPSSLLEDLGTPQEKQKQPRYTQKQLCTPLVIAGDSQAASSDQIASCSPLPHSSSQSPQISENTPPWTSSRTKHISGSSTSSQKSRKVSGDSDKSFKKGNKSDSNSSLSSSGGRSKRRIPSRDKSPGGNSDKGPLSPLKVDEFSWSGHYSGKSLEAKMIPMETKIRHSLGDVTDAVESVGNKENPGHGLVRPGSTPCIQHLDSSSDDLGNKSSIESVSTQKMSHESHSTSRSRHSLSDLGAYQHIASGGSLSPLLSNVSADNATTNSDSVLDQPKKVLNYAQLDLSNPIEGESEGKVLKTKFKNFSDSDDREPPLSYAKIDFEKCQNMKALALEGTQDSSSKT